MALAGRRQVLAQSVQPTNPDPNWLRYFALTPTLRIGLLFHSFGSAILSMQAAR